MQSYSMHSYAWLLLLTFMFVGLIQVTACSLDHFHYLIVFHFRNIPQLIHLPWVGFGQFPDFGYCEQCNYKHSTCPLEQVLLGVSPRKGIPGWPDMHKLSISTCCQTVSLSHSTIVHSHQQYSSFSPTLASMCFWFSFQLF